MKKISEMLKSATWLSVPAEAYEDAVSAYGKILVAWFRASFIAENPECLLIAMSANSRYKLWMNGKRAGFGPCKATKGKVYYDELDLTSMVVAGNNELLVQVIYYPLPEYGMGGKSGPQSVVSNVPGAWFLAAGLLSERNGEEKEVLLTGQHSWEVMTDNAYKWSFQDYLGYTITGPYEEVEGGLLPFNTFTKQQNWIMPALKDKAFWSSFGESSPLPLFERPIPLLYEKRREFPKEIIRNESNEEYFGFSDSEWVRIPPKKKMSVLLDAGELTTGFLRLNLEAGKNSIIRLYYAESSSRKGKGQYYEKGRRDDFDNFCFEGYHDEYKSSGKIETYEPYWYRTFRFILLEVETMGEAITVHKPYYIETGYPIENTSRVESGTSWIKPLWDISVNTLQRCMHETYEDCPYYEQMQYILDSKLEALYTYGLNGDSRLAVKSLSEFHDGRRPDGMLNCRQPSFAPNVIPSFALHWIMMLEDYYIQSGNLNFVQSMMPTVAGALNWFNSRRDSNGLIGKSEFWDFVDWVEEWQNEEGMATGTPSAIKNGPSTTISLMYSCALQTAARLHNTLKQPDVAGQYLETSKQINSSVKSLCWSEKDGLFRDGPEVEEYTQHAQVWAVLSGAISKETGKKVLTCALQREGILLCSFASAYFLFRALEATDLYELTKNLWKPWIEAVDKGLTSWPEDFTRQRSDCHGWSALPLYEFTSCLLGVRPQEAGWKGIRVQPNYSVVSDIEGEVATPVGLVKVSWERTGNKVSLLVESPAGILLEIIPGDGKVYKLEQGGVFREAEIALK